MSRAAMILMLLALACTSTTPPPAPTTVEDGDIDESCTKRPVPARR